MNLEQLPQEFLERMEHMLGEEYPAFLQSYEEPRKFGLRVNTMKISVEEFQRLAPFHLTPIPWIPNGFYYEREDDPARHPFYYAGLYYLQEPSAMTPASILPVMQGEHDWIYVRHRAEKRRRSVQSSRVRDCSWRTISALPVQKHCSRIWKFSVSGIPLSQMRIRQSLQSSLPGHLIKSWWMLRARERVCSGRIWRMPEYGVWKR